VFVHQALEHRDAVHAGHEEIQHDELVATGLREVEPVETVGGAVDPEPFRGERPRDEARDARFVVHHEHAGHSRILGTRRVPTEG